MAGRVVEGPDGDGRMREGTEGGICHWGREAAGGIDAFRAEIRAAFGGRAPRVLDPFAGGGAIPLEAMRLGCEAVAADINPVAWFLLRCTLHYPRLTAGQARPLPAFALEERAFAEAFLKARGVGKRAFLEAELARLGHGGGKGAQTTSPHLDAGGAQPFSGAPFAWHVRAWGRRVLAAARRALAARYPTYAEFEPALGKGRRGQRRPPPRHRPRAPRLLAPDGEAPIDGGGAPVAALNAGFDRRYLENEANPRWVAKPTVAYLWARTVRCGGCRAEVPLLKTRWLCKTAKKRVLLTMTPRGDGVAFGVERDVPQGPAAQRRARDRELGAGTMSGSGATCPCCGAVATTADIRAEGRAGRLGARMTAVVTEGQQGKEYRLPTEAETAAAQVGREELDALYAAIPFGLPVEPTPSEKALGFRAPLYGFDQWAKLFTDRQLLALGTFARELRRCAGEMEGYPEEWREALAAYLCLIFSKLADYSSALCSWHKSVEAITHTFARFALPMVWDFCEVNPLSAASGGFAAMAEWAARALDHLEEAAAGAPRAQVLRRSAIEAAPGGGFDAIVTDPPYYDAIPYSDLMDFFHVWLRRALWGLAGEIDAAFAQPLGPKWEAGGGELIDDASRHGGDRRASRRAYEEGMARAFGACHGALRQDGRLVVVFANKAPDAWETLVSALIRAGFVVTGSWPIRTEMQNRQRNLASAALSSSIWLVCRKREAAAKAGWDARVLAEMRENIARRLRDFWDAGIRGPDFVWAATGPALEAFSRHPAVRKADEPGAVLTVAGFLREARRMVVGFAVSRLLRREEGATGELDDPTAYYLLHRNDFGLEPAPAGACILYALSCNLSDADLAGRLDLLARGGARTAEEGGEEARAAGGEARLKPWHRRGARDLGEAAADGSPPPLIDQLHRTMRLWKAGEQSRVDAWLTARGLWHHELFARVTQATIELAEAGSEERAMLESIQNHLRSGGGAAPAGNLLL